MLMGLTRPSSGEAVVCGLDPVRRAKDVKRIIGYMPENVGFYPELDAVQSLEYIAALNGIPESEARDKIDEFLVRFFSFLNRINKPHNLGYRESDSCTQS